MSNRYQIAALCFLSISACRGERTITPATAPPKAATVTPVTPAERDVGAQEEPLPTWGAFPDGIAKPPKKGTLRRAGDAVVFTVNDGRFSLPADLDFGECVDAPSALGPAPSLTDAKVTDTTAWLRFDNASEGVLLRLTPYHAALLSEAGGCLREVDVTPLLLATTPGDADALITIGATIPDTAREIGTVSGEFPSPTAPPSAVTGPFLGDARPVTLSVGPTAASLTLTSSPLLSVEYDLGHFSTRQGSFTAYALGTTHWYSVTMSGERTKGSRVSGREETATWSWNGSAPELVARATNLYGATEPEREDEALVVERHVSTQDGGLSVLATRATLSDARMVGAGRCPEMEGVLEYRFREDRAVWKAWTEDGRSVVLGETARKFVEASGCFGEAKREISKAQRTEFLRPPKSSIRWTASPGWGLHAPAAPTISGR